MTQISHYGMKFALMKLELFTSGKVRIGDEVWRYD